MNIDYSTNMPAAGAILEDGKFIAETRRCVHCSAQWVSSPGSGTRRGFCMGCKGLLCGQAPCMQGCVPLEARLQGIERGQNKLEVLKDIDSMGKTIVLGAI